MQRHRFAATALLMLGFFTLGARQASAEIKPHPLFSENAVLQQGKKVPVWGTTDKTDPVKVRFAGQEVSATPADGKWQVELAPLAASANPQTLTITQGAYRVELKDVLVGEVWICGGQSNMELELKDTDHPEEAVAAANYPNIRLFYVEHENTPKPQAEPKVRHAWKPCTPETAAGFSGVGYYFGRDLHKLKNVPIGLISSNVGGTPVEQWIGPASKGKEREYKAFRLPRNHSGLYNAMIAPLAPYAIRGAIWYQGEGNTGRAMAYRKLFPAMIQSWRDTFGQGDFPFLFVQLAPFFEYKPERLGRDWATLRESQLRTLDVAPNTAMAVITDVGDPDDIHPKRKAQVGARLVLAARALAYGEPIEYSGPSYEGMTVADGKVVLRFKHTGGGLVAKDGELTGFTIAGEDKVFHPATAKIEGETVVVSSSDTPHPVAVRYGWLNCPVVNLWSKLDLPASPFRTDDFPIPPGPYK